MDNTLEAKVKLIVEDKDKAQKVLNAIQDSVKKINKSGGVKVNAEEDSNKGGSSNAGKIAGKVGLAVIGIRSIFTLIRKIVGNNDNLVSAVNILFSTVANALAPVLNFIAGLIALIASFLGNIFKVSTKNASANSASAKSLAGFDEINNLNTGSGGGSGSKQLADLTPIIEKVKATIEKVVEATILLVMGVWQTIKYIFSGGLEGIVGLVLSTFAGIGGFIVGFIGSLGDNFRGALDKGYGVVSAVFVAVWESLKSGVRKFGETFKAVWSGFKGVLDEKLVTPIKTTFAKLWNDYLRSPLQKVMNGIARIVNGLIGGVNWVIGKINSFGLFGKFNTVSTWAGVTLPTYANGGFPASGQMFVARESGPELVGTIGGHSAVANNDQIIEGIKRGVIEALTSASINANLFVDGKQLTDSVVKNIKSQQRLVGGSIL